MLINWHCTVRIYNFCLYRVSEFRFFFRLRSRLRGWGCYFDPRNNTIPHQQDNAVVRLFQTDIFVISERNRKTKYDTRRLFQVLRIQGQDNHQIGQENRGRFRNDGTQPFVGRFLGRAEEFQSFCKLNIHLYSKVIVPFILLLQGLTDPENGKKNLLGSYTFVMKKDQSPIQNFPVSSSIFSNDLFEFVELEICDNHGNQKYTSIYRFRVHAGKN